MTEEQAQPAPSLGSSVKRWLPGVLISAVILALVIRNVTWAEMMDAFTRVSPGVLAGALGLFLLAQLFRALCWSVLLQHKVPLKRVFFTMNEGYLLNNVFPFRMGELGRAVLLGTNTELTTFTVLSTIVMERFYDLAISAILLLATLPLVLTQPWVKPAAVAVLALVIVGLVVIFFMGRNREKLLVWSERIFPRWRFFHRWIVPKLDELLSGFGVLNRPSLFLLSLGLMLVSWFMALAEYYLLLKAIAPQAQVWWVPFMLGFAAFGGAIPAAPGGIGVLEGAIVFALTLVGMDASSALAFALMMHAIQFALSTIFGLVGLAQEGGNLSSLYHSLLTRRSSRAA